MLGDKKKSLRLTHFISTW